MAYLVASCRVLGLEGNKKEWWNEVVNQSVQ